MRKVYFLPLLFSCVLVHAQPGVLDGGFNGTGTVTTPIGPGLDEAWGMAVQPDGKVVVAGRASNGTDWDFFVVRYNIDGSLDLPFGGGDGKVTNGGAAGGNDYAFQVIIQPDGKIAVCGVMNFGGGDNGDNDFTVIRYLADGTLDLPFGGGDGIATVNLGPAAGTNDHCQAFALQGDGKFILGGYRASGSNADFAIARINADGSPDLPFGGGDGVVTTDVVSGLETNGSGQEDFVAQVLIQNDGKYVLSGSTGGGGAYDFALIRYNSDGTLDLPFGGGDGIVYTSIGGDDHAYGAVLQPNQKIVQAGWAQLSGQNDFAVMRYNADGTLDNTFGGGTGIVTVNVAGGTLNDMARSVKIQSDLKLVVGGSTDIDMAVLRLNIDGSVDLPFGGGDGIALADPSGGQWDEQHTMALFANRIYLAGFSMNLGNREVGVAAFQNDASALPLTLAQFTAQKQTTKVLLQWQTSLEENVNQFVIERSNDGKTYTSIGQVKATGNSSSTKNYSFTDQSPFASTSNYYRLLMQDVDGNVKYSKVLIVKFDGQLTTNLQIFPSPVNSTLQVQVPAGLNGNTTLQIIDFSGRILRSMHLTTDGNALNTSFDVTNLIKGVYILKAQAGNTNLTTRFTKQ